MSWYANCNNERFPSRWWCDTCGELIPWANLGRLEWLRTCGDVAQPDVNFGFRICHANNRSCRIHYPGDPRCVDEPLGHFTGRSGKEYLRLSANSPTACRIVRDPDEWDVLYRRLYEVGYEEIYRQSPEAEQLLGKNLTRRERLLRYGRIPPRRAYVE